MTVALTGTELARPFVPAKDFDLSKRFYREVGFELIHDGSIAIFAIGPTSFLLQNYYNKDWAENFMMQLMVDDLDAWWSHLSSLNLPSRFAVPPPKPPELQSWGLRVSYLVDPSGVLWHIAQKRSDVSHDAPSNSR